MSGTIVIIEDDQEMCDMLSAGLSRRDFMVATYTSGKQGLAAVDMHATDVVLADINLPDMNGLDICRDIVAGMRDIPVIVMTAFGSMDTAIAAIRAGAYDFVTKTAGPGYPCLIPGACLSLQRAAENSATAQQRDAAAPEVR